jgi:hypothetical protein
MQILSENVNILTWILHDFCLNFIVGGVLKPYFLTKNRIERHWKIIINL